MSENEWIEIRGRLEAIGFSVDLASLYFHQRQPFWRVIAYREGRTWSVSGGELNEIFVELENLTRFGKRFITPRPPKESLSTAGVPLTPPRPGHQNDLERREPSRFRRHR